MTAMGFFETEQIVRLYVTHPGVTADGIMTKMGFFFKGLTDKPFKYNLIVSGTIFSTGFFFA